MRSALALSAPKSVSLATGCALIVISISSGLSGSIFLDHAVFQAALPDFHARVVDHHKAVFPQSAANAAHGLINSHS